MTSFKKKTVWQKIFFVITYPIYLVEIVLIYLYKFLISPLLPKNCRFFPTCSTYFLQALKEYNIFKGFYLGVKRIVRCNPFSKESYYDPIPINIKGNAKWIL